MFALVNKSDNSITKTYSGRMGITIGENQYPQTIFTLWSEAERNAIDIYTIEIDESKRKSEEWYINTNITYAFDGSKVTGSYGDATAKAHADTKWIQSEIDAGDAPEGADTDTVKEEGLKTEEEVKNWAMKHGYGLAVLDEFVAEWKGEPKVVEEVAPKPAPEPAPEPVVEEVVEEVKPAVKTKKPLFGKN